MTARAVAAIAVTIILASCGAEPATPPATSRAVEIRGPGGTTLTGRATGRGDTAVVLAHGASTTMASWYAVMRPLARAGYRVVAFDARGVGRSDGPRSDDPAARAADLGAVVRALRADGARRIVVAGSSLGSIATLDYAATNPVAAAIVVSPPGVPPSADRIRTPVQIVTSRGDMGPTATARALGRLLGTTPVIVDGDIHGADLFRSHPRAIRDLVRFITEHAPPD